MPDYLSGMPLLVSDAIVLHAFDYMESSRILRLATREGGVRSVLARGARSSRQRFGTALDLFAQGSAQLSVRVGRDLDTLTSFDVVQSRPELAQDLGRFTGASMIAELVLRFATAHADAGLFKVVAQTLDRIAAAAPERSADAALAGAWHVISTLGFSPSVSECAECHAEIPDDATVAFHYSAGGVLCARCSSQLPGGRRLPPDARQALRAWASGDPAPTRDAESVRAHQRLLREFLIHHVADERPLRAFAMWEERGVPRSRAGVTGKSS